MAHQSEDRRRLPPSAEKLLELVRTRAYERSAVPFVLSSGATSYDYVDMRRAVARGDDLRIAAEALIDHLAALDCAYDAIGGMTMGSDPVAHAVALLGGKAWFAVRKYDKSHGSRRRVEGIDLDGARVVLFDDTISTGGSILEAYEVALAAGAEVVHACSLFDRSEAAKAAFSELGVSYSSVLDYRDLGIDPLLVPSPRG